MICISNMAEDGLPTIVDVGVTHSLADTYSRNTSVGVRGYMYAATRYAKSKDPDYKKVIRDNNLQLHSRSAVMETYGAFGDSLWGIITELWGHQRAQLAELIEWQLRIQ